MEGDRPASTVPGAQRCSRSPTTWLAAVLAVLVAAVLAGGLARIAPNAKWPPVVAWLLAGAAAGLVVQRRMPALVVALLTTISAAVVSVVVMLLQTGHEPHLGGTHQAAPPMPSLSDITFTTLACGLACVVGAVAMVELHRNYERRRR